MCKSRDPFFIQALSLELAGERRFATLAALANNKTESHYYEIYKIVMIIIMKCLYRVCGVVKIPKTP